MHGVHLHSYIPVRARTKAADDRLEPSAAAALPARQPGRTFGLSGGTKMQKAPVF